jgi:hypothetical protein
MLKCKIGEVDIDEGLAVSSEAMGDKFNEDAEQWWIVVI